MPTTPTTPHEPIPSYLLEAALELWRKGEGEHFLPVSGGSMLPLIHDGDQLLVTHGVASARRGDVLLFRQGDQLIAHRLLARQITGGEVRYLTKGDNMLGADPLVPVAEIMGKVVLVCSGDRQLSLDTPLWRSLNWLIAVVMLGWTKLYAALRAVRRKIWGRDSSRMTRAVSRITRACFSGLINLLQFLFSRKR